MERAKEIARQTGSQEVLSLVHHQLLRNNDENNEVPPKRRVRRGETTRYIGVPETCINKDGPLLTEAAIETPEQGSAAETDFELAEAKPIPAEAMFANSDDNGLV